MKVYAKAVAAGLAVYVGALATAIPAASEEEVDAIAMGQAIMQKNCARCHAVGTEDDSQHEDAPPFRVIVTRYAPHNLAEALAEGIVSGHPDMPEFVFEPDEIGAIVAYLNTLMPPEDEDVPEQE